MLKTETNRFPVLVKVETRKFVKNNGTGSRYYYTGTRSRGPNSMNNKNLIRSRMYTAFATLGSALYKQGLVSSFRDFLTESSNVEAVAGSLRLQVSYKFNLFDYGSTEITGIYYCTSTFSYFLFI